MLEASQEIFSPTAYNVKLRGFFPILSIRFDVFHVFFLPIQKIYASSLVVNQLFKDLPSGKLT